MARPQTVPCGTIDHLIRLPEDAASERIGRGLAWSIGTNVVVLCIATVASSIPSVRSGPGQRTPYWQFTFDDPKSLTQPVALPKRPEIRPMPKLPDLRRKIVREKPIPRMTKPPVAPVPRTSPTVRTPPISKVAQASTERPDRSTSNPAPADATTVVRPRDANSEPTRSAVTAATPFGRNFAAETVAPGASAPAILVGTPRAADPEARLASERTGRVASASEGAAGTVAASGASAPAGAPVATLAARGLTSGTVAGVGVRGGVVSLGSGGMSVSMSTAVVAPPSFVGRRGPAIGSTRIQSDRAVVLSTARSETGSAPSGLATMEAVRGVVQTSIALRPSSASTGPAASSRAAGGVGIGASSQGDAATVGPSGYAVGVRSGVVGGAGLATLERGGVASVGGEIRGAGALAGATGSGDPGGAMVRSAGGGGPVVRGGAGVVRAGGGNREIGAAGGVDASVRGGTDVAAGDRSKVPAKGEGGLATRGETGGSAATRNEDASPIARRDVELSSELKRRRFSARVLIQVNVDADGRHTESLLQGSGDSDVDTAVLRALAGWKWEPAYRDGIKVRSTRKFEYRIKVED